MYLSPHHYRKAYAHYLRRGTPLDIGLKAAEYPTPYYIWRTRGDDKVRSAHAENNGKIFAWNDPPPTGNPGEDYGCRCWGEPYYNIPNDPPIEPIYPIETLVGLVSGGGVLGRLAFSLLRRISDIDAKTLSASQFNNLQRFDKNFQKMPVKYRYYVGKLVKEFLEQMYLRKTYLVHLHAMRK